MRGHRALADPFFSTTGGTAGGSHNRAVDTPEFSVDFTHVDMGCPQMAQDLIERPVNIPIVEQIPDGLPGRVFLGQIPPRCAGPENPENCIHDFSSVPRRPSSRSRRWENVRNTTPLIVSEFVSGHP